MSTKKTNPITRRDLNGWHRHGEKVQLERIQKGRKLRCSIQVFISPDDKYKAVLNVKTNRVIGIAENDGRLDIKMINNNKKFVWHRVSKRKW